MRYLLVAADKSSRLPVEIPDEILTHKPISKAKPAQKSKEGEKTQRQIPLKKEA